MNYSTIRCQSIFLRIFASNSYSISKHQPYHFVNFYKTATEIKLLKLIGKSDCKVARDIQSKTLQTLLLVKTSFDLEINLVLQ